MEKHTFEFPAGAPARSRSAVGVVGSGDLEVLLEPHGGDVTTVAVTTSVDGFATTWRAVLTRIFSSGAHPAARIEINDFGATPGVVRMRIEQALEEAGSGHE